MACWAFMSTLLITCSIWCLSILQGRVFSSMCRLQETFEPLSTNLTVSSIKPARNSVFFTGAPPLEKVKSCRVKWRARSMAPLAVIKYLTVSSSAVFNITRSILPNIPVRRLLKSWAMPPARIPRDSSFCEFNSNDSAFFRFVTSYATPMIFSTCPFSSMMGVYVTSKTISSTISSCCIIFPFKASSTAPGIRG